MVYIGRPVNDKIRWQNGRHTFVNLFLNSILVYDKGKAHNR